VPPDPEHIGPYQVIRRLGAGGMGEVFLAHDPRLERQVAVKRIRTDGPPDPSLRARLRREARLAASLQHPAVVQVFDWVTEDGADHIVFELVPGTTLRQALAKRGGPLPLPEALTVAVRVAEGLAYAHRRGVVHRDLKTENVLLTEEGEAKISDFGIARRLAGEVGQEGLTREGVVLGTYRAMAPEQLQGRPADYRSDLFSFGVLLYELCTGRSPFLGDTGPVTVGRILHQRQTPAAELAPGLPPALSALIDRLLEKEPVLRPRDAAEVASELSSLAAAVGEESDATLVVPAQGLPGTPARTPPPPAGASVTSDPAPPAPTPAAAVAPETGPRQGWGMGARGALAGAVVLAVVLAAALGLLLVRGPTSAPAAPLYVAVLAPEGPRGEGEEQDRLLAFAVRNALTRTLASLEGVFPKSAREVDAVPGPPAAVARAVAADEVVTASLACEAASCWAEISRVRGGDGGVVWSETVPVPRDRPLAAARAVGLRLRDAYPDRPPRPGVPELAVAAGDYAKYLELERALDSGLGQRSAEDVLEGLAAVRRGSPGFLDAYLLAASLEVRLYAASGDDPGHLDRALELMRRAEALAPGDPEVKLQRAYVELQAERLDEAAATLAALEEQIPGHVGLLDLSAELARRRGRPEGALALSRQAVARQPSWYRLYTHAQLAFEQGETGEARQSLEELLERVPGHAAGKWLLAWLELTTGDVARAADLFAEIAKERPYAGAWVNLGLARLLLGEPAAAAEAIAHAVETDPANPLFVLNLADARALEGRPGEAETLYRRVLELLGGEAGAAGWQQLSARAQALAHLGRHREAVAASQEAQRRAPNNGQAVFEAALVSTLVGDRTAALVQAERAVELGWQPRFFELPWFDPLRGEPGFDRLLAGEPGAAP
jgi:serine/threonine-protein kinase